MASILVLLAGLALANGEIPMYGQQQVKDDPEHSFDIKTPPRAKQESCNRFVETLRNDGNGAAYLGSLHIGGNEFDKVIWDTGSDQQVVNSARTMNLRHPCAYLPDAHKHCYNAYLSADYERLDDSPKRIEYGSGDTMVLTGTDTLGITGGQCLVEHMPFYELMATDISPILKHDIDVVAGLAPNKFTGISLIKEMKVDRFSFCFNKDVTKDGMLVWSDMEPADNTGFRFFSAPVSGSANYWSVKINDLALDDTGDKTVVGCGGADGCTAIIDTGTSLLTLDHASLTGLESFVEKFDTEKMECNEETLNKFPTLNMKIDGNDLYLRPEDYITYTEVMDAQMPQQMKDTRDFWVSRYPALGNMFADKMQGEKKCVLMFTEPIADNVIILGMPTFRNYMVTFDRWHHRVNFARHNGNCEPIATSFRQKRNIQRLQKVDMTKLQYSNAYHTLYKKNLQLKQQREVEALALKQKEKVEAIEKK